MTIFERIISDDQVEDAVIESLRTWLPTYMSEVERQVGLEAPYYQRPAESSYTVKTDFDAWPEDMLPIVIVVSPGLEDEPVKRGRGIHDGKFDIGIVCVVSSMDSLETRQYAQRMGAAARVALIQQGIGDALGNSCQGVDFVGSRNNELPPDGERTIRAYRQLFTVQIGEIATRMAGPVQPDPLDPDWTPYPEWPTVPDPNSVIVDMTKEPIEP